MRLNADWRPLSGLSPGDQGTVIERVIATAVIRKAVELHNRDAQKAERG